MKNIWTNGLSQDTRKTCTTKLECNITALSVQKYFKQRLLSILTRQTNTVVMKNESASTAKKFLPPKLMPWIVWLSFHAQDLQKYHPLGSSTYCENTKISCIPQNFKYITTSDSFIRSQLILVAPCVIRQFCRYCPYSNKPVIWATVPDDRVVQGTCRGFSHLWAFDWNAVFPSGCDRKLYSFGQGSVFEGD